MAIVLGYLTVAYATKVAIDLSTISVICPAVGVALGVLAVYGIDLAPAVALGSWSGALILGASPVEAIAGALSCTTGAAIGIYVLGLGQWQPKLPKLKPLFQLIFAGLILSTAIAAILETLFGLGLHTISSSGIFEHLWNLWLSQSMGGVLVAPILIYGMTSAGNSEVEIKSLAHWIETSIAIGLGLVLSSLVFGIPDMGWIENQWIQELSDIPLEYLCFPLIVWVGVRYGAIAVFSTSLLIMVLAAIGLSQDQGLLMLRSESSQQALVQLQVLMGSMEITALIVVAHLTEIRVNTGLLCHNKNYTSAEISHRETSILELETTLRRQKQTLQEHQEALSRANQLNNCFFQAIAHDLRTTVIGMVMFHHHLLKQPGETLSIRRSVVQRLAEGGDRQLRKLNTLLKVATLETDLQAIQPEAIDLPLLLEPVLQNMQPDFQANQVHLTYHQPEQLPPVDADPEYIRRVFEHLLSNALKHNPPGIAIEIQFQAHPSSRVYCSVTDTGVGIAPEKHPHLFSLDPQPSEHQRNGSLMGIALGLYECDRILAAHGGKLGVESHLSQGSHFWFCLPEHRSPSVNLS